MTVISVWCNLPRAFFTLWLVTQLLVPIVQPQFISYPSSDCFCICGGASQQSSQKFVAVEQQLLRRDDFSPADDSAHRARNNGVTPPVQLLQQNFNLLRRKKSNGLNYFGSVPLNSFKSRIIKPIVQISLGLSQPPPVSATASRRVMPNKCMPMKQFACDSGECILNYYQCDGRAQCRDGSDERDCPPPPLSANAFGYNQTNADPSTNYHAGGSGQLGIYPRYTTTVRPLIYAQQQQNAAGRPAAAAFQCNAGEATCANGECISREYVCDGSADCLDGSDELGCSAKSCEATEMRCANGICVQKIWRCDGEDDCGDMTDERGCATAAPGAPCQADEFKCVTSTPLQCIPRAFRCDGTPDCLDGSDEWLCSAPKIISNCQNETRLTRGARLSLTCTASGVPPPFINWRLNWKRIDTENDRRIAVTSDDDGTGTLTITGVQANDAGAYTCEAINTIDALMATPDCIVYVDGSRGSALIGIGGAAEAGKVMIGGDIRAPTADAYDLADPLLTAEISEAGRICSPPLFNSEARSRQDCLQCFCFGVTDRCQSSALSRVTIDMRGEPQVISRTTNLPAENVYVRFEPSDSSHTVQYASAAQNDNLYWRLPHDFIGGNQLKSYGGSLSFEVVYDVTADSDSNAENLPPDVVIESDNNLTLYYRFTADQQATSAGRFLKIEVPLEAHSKQGMSAWSRTPVFRAGRAGGDGQVTRSDLMLALENIRNVDILLSRGGSAGRRAQASGTTRNARLSNVRLNSAAQQQSSSSPTNRAALVEQCFCPNGYEGTSCELCSLGYERFHTGRYLGECVLQTLEQQRQKEQMNVNIYPPPPPMPPPPPPPPSVMCSQAGSYYPTPDPYSGACVCKPNTAPPFCDRCRDGFYGLDARNPEGCRRCECNNHAQTCDPNTGACINCRHNTVGDQCQYCAPGYVGDPRGASGCIQQQQTSIQIEALPPISPHRPQSPPSISGSAYDSPTTSFYPQRPAVPVSGTISGQQQGYGTISGSADGGAPGRIGGSSGAYLCDPLGSVSPQPDPYTGQCQCRPAYTGPLCDRCAAGSFNPHGGCERCFCSGVTDQCASTGSSLYRTSMPIDERQVEIVRGSDVPDAESDGGLYWSLPASALGRRVTSYGGELRFEIQNAPSRRDRLNEAEINAPVEVLLHGNQIALHFNESLSPPSPAGRGSRTVVVPFVEQHWHRSGDGQISNREHLLMALSNVTQLLIRIPGTDGDDSAAPASTISNIFLDTTALVPSTARDQLAYQVEQCSCPSGYEGTSCERCAYGYRRTGSGLYLGVCKPCECNGYSDYCDPDSGVCQNCRYNTAGEQCQLCAPGYDGVPYRGQPNACQPSTSSSVVVDAPPSPVSVSGYEDELQQPESLPSSVRPVIYGATSTTTQSSAPALQTPPYEYRPILTAQVEEPVWTTQRLMSLTTPSSLDASTSPKIVFADLHVNIIPHSVERVEGSGIRLTCNVRSRYPVVVTWGRDDGRPLQREAQITDRDLILSDVKQRDAGRYICRAYIAQRPDIEQTAASQVTVLRTSALVTSPPEDDARTIYVYVQEPKRIVVNVGQKVDLRCYARSLVTYTLFWSKTDGGGVLSRRATDHLNGRLTIDNAQIADSGHYECTGSNFYNTDRDTVELLVVNEATPRAPTVTVSPSLVTALPGDTVELVCVADGQPLPEIVWSKQKSRQPSTSSSTEQLDMRRSTIEGGLLTIQDLNKNDDEAEYVCRARNTAGQSEARAVVTVREAAPVPSAAVLPPMLKKNDDFVRVAGEVTEEGEANAPPRVQVDKAVVQVEAGGSVQLICRMVFPRVEDGSQHTNVGSDSKIEWQHYGKGEMINEQHMRQRTLEQGRVAVLDITDAKREDAGVYVCLASNHAGSHAAQTILNVTAPSNYYHQGRQPQPKSNDQTSASNLATGPFAVTIEPSGVQNVLTVPQHSDVMLNCLVNGQQPPPQQQNEFEILWSRYRTQQPEALPNFTNNSTLTLRNIQVEDRGVYLCDVTSRTSSNSARASLIIEIERREPPEVEIFPEMQQTVPKYANVLFQCRVVGGQPPPSITWTRSGGALPSTARVEQGNVLRFDAVDTGDAGQYECQAENDAGKTNKVVTLHIIQDEAESTGQNNNLVIYPAGDVVEQPEGTALRLECYFTGVGGQQNEVVWRSDNGQQYPQRNGELLIDSLHPTDAGIYTCQHWQQNSGTTERQIRVIVLPQQSPETVESVTIASFDWSSSTDVFPVRVPLLQLTSSNLALPVGETAAIACVYFGQDPPVEQVDVEWQRQRDSGNNDWRTIPSEKGLLMVSGVQPHDAGQYQCVARNKANQQILASEIAVIRTLGQPYQPPRGFYPDAPANELAASQTPSNGELDIEIIPARHEALVGGTVRFECRRKSSSLGTTNGDNDDEPDDEYTFDWEKLGGNGQLRPSTTQQTPGTLEIDHISIEDSGQYRCIVRNARQRKQQQAYADLIVSEAPSIRVADGQHHVRVRENDVVTLRCDILSGFPQPTVKWEKLSSENDEGSESSQAERASDERLYLSARSRSQQSLPPYAYHERGHDTTLVLSGIQRDTGTGRYACIASNSVGEARDELVVQVVAPDQALDGESDNENPPNTTTTTAPFVNSTNLPKPRRTREIRIESTSPTTLVDEGTNFVLTCYIVGDTTQPVEWLVRKQAETNFTLITSDGAGPQVRNIHSLQFRNTKQRDAGEYLCQTTAVATESVVNTSFLLQVRPRVRLSLLNKLKVLRTPKGGPIHMECPISGSSQDPLWERLEGSLPKYAISDGRRRRLTISRATPNDAGTYTCSSDIIATPPDPVARLRVTNVIPRFTGAVSSYARMAGPLQNAQQKFDISISFRPVARNGLMLYNGGQGVISQMDFIAVGIGNDSHVEFWFNLGDFVTLIRSARPVELNKFHTLRLHRNKKEATLYVDDQQPPVIGQSRGGNVGLDVSDALYVGGVADRTRLPADLGKYGNFQGCISQLILNDKTIELMPPNALQYSTAVGDCNVCSATTEENPCLNGGLCQDEQNEDGFMCMCQRGYSGQYCQNDDGFQCSDDTCGSGSGQCVNTDVGFQCQCPLGTEGNRCQWETGGDVKEPAFTGNSYMLVPRTSVTTLVLNVDLTIRFDSHVSVFDKNGDQLLLYAAQYNATPGDFVALVLNRDRRLVVVIDIGSGPFNVTSQQQLGVANDDAWHRIRIERNGRDARLLIDDREEGAASASGTLKGLNLGTGFYVGGVPPTDVNGRHDPTKIKLPEILQKITSGFHGCIAKLVINDAQINLLNDSLEIVNIRDCNIHNPCDKRPCANNSTCIHTGPFAYSCECAPGFTGQNCQVEQNACTTAQEHRCKNGGTCVDRPDTPNGYECLCPFGFSGVDCSQKQMSSTTSGFGFHGSSYLELPGTLLPRTSIDQTENVELTLRTRNADGLVFWHGQPPNVTGKGQDFVSLSLEGGLPVFRFELGGGPANITGSKRVDDGQKHSILLQRLTRNGTLTIDGTSTQSGSSVGQYQVLNADGNIFIGGVPDYSRMTGGQFATGFDGCLERIQLNGLTIDLPKQVITGRTVDRCDDGLQ